MSGKKQRKQRKVKLVPTMKRKCSISNAMVDCMTIDKTCELLNQFFRDSKEQKPITIPAPIEDPIVLEIPDEEVVKDVSFPEPEPLENMFNVLEKDFDSNYDFYSLNI